MRFYQQGDVIMEPILKKELPASLKPGPSRNNKFILAEGEVTGHCHAIAEDEGTLYADADGNLFLSVFQNTATITHQEHGKMVLPKGNYKVRQVQEYDHFTEEARNVAD